MKLNRRLSLYRILACEAEFKGNDSEIAKIMTDMEKEFNIPALAENIPQWEEKTIGAEQILDCYREIGVRRRL